jgi:hypothetical protein
VRLEHALLRISFSVFFKFMMRDYDRFSEALLQKLARQLEKYELDSCRILKWIKVTCTIDLVMHYPEEDSLLLAPTEKFMR